MKKLVYEPIKLRGERVWRTYIGGREIGFLHGDVSTVDGHFPEEWMFSVTQAHNAGREEKEEGVCKLDGDRAFSLKELIEAYPLEMLGREHMERWGTSTGVLIKIIDSLERLTVQVHPDKEKAERLFHRPFGKTECWHILGTRDDIGENPCIYLGFKEGIRKEQWVRCFENQNTDKMLSLLNRIEVKAGETYLVKGGVPHAIGSGCLIVEIQEPTDYTVRVERVTPSGFEIADSMCHQGLGFQTMFECFDYDGMSLEAVREAYCKEPEEKAWEFGRRRQLIGYSDTPCFQMEWLEISHSCQLKGDGLFSCLYVLSGQGTLKSETQEYALKRNDQFFIPAVSLAYSITCSDENPVCILLMRGPETVRLGLDLK